MYHLEEYTYWYNDLNINLDSAGVWGTQGPLGILGALGVLGALGPTSISVLPGMTTTSEGKYLTLTSSGSSVVVRQTQPLRYAHDGSFYRVYDLFEMYSRSYALTMCSSPPPPSSSASLPPPPASCDANDSSFGVDASTVLTEKHGEDQGDGHGVITSGLMMEDGVPIGVSDKYSFVSKYNQFVHLNLIPYGGTPGLPPVGLIPGSGSWSSLNMTLSLSCGSSSSPSSKTLLQTTTSNFLASSITSSRAQNDLSPFITTRLRKNEFCEVSVILQLPSSKNSTADNDWTGYYLYVTGSGLRTVSQGTVDADPDLWGARLQADGTSAFNLNGPHQVWIPF
jgi:hypothetical protein